MTPYTVFLSPANQSFSAHENESILSAGLNQGLRLPHSCQSGVCGSCKATLLSGEISKHDVYDDYILTPAEKEAGMVLLCCCQARSDISIHMPSYAGKMALPIRTLPARIGTVDIRGEVAVLTVNLPKAPPFVFFAGQYMDFLLNEHTRSYSIANAPNQTNTLEFHIRHRQGGLLSEQIFNGTLKSGSVVRLRGPLGAFTLDENSQKPLLFLATGTGFAPIKSLLQDMVYRKIDRPVHFYHNVRHQRELYDQTALLEILANLPNSQYTPVLSREIWQGKQGHITQQVVWDHPDLSGFQVYACGAPAMVVSARDLFAQQHGLALDDFFSDVFSASVSS